MLIAAIISILVAIFTISSIAFDWNIFEELKNRFGTVADTPVNQEIDVDGVSVYMRGERKDYNSLEDVLKKEGLNLLFPTKLPTDTILKKIMLSNFESKEKLVFSFNDKKFTYTILFNNTLPEDVFSDDNVEILKINEIECYVIDMQDLGQVQVYFVQNNNLYKLTYNNKQDLIEVIENLKELE